MPSRYPPFESIEEAQAYIHVLLEIVEETGASEELRNLGVGSPRRADTVNVVQYKLRQLGTHLQATKRLLNDLRTLRRLLLGERDGRPEVAAHVS